MRCQRWLLRKMLGLNTLHAAPLEAPLAHALPANGPRTHFMRATLRDGQLQVADSQDSSLLTVLSTANALLLRAPHDPERSTGEILNFVPI